MRAAKPDWRLRLVVSGDGPLLSQSRALGVQTTIEPKIQVDQLNLSQRVGLTDFVENPAAVMRALDIVVHASTQPEPFGLVIAEGMATGRAVIVSIAWGAAELISAGTNALSQMPGDANGLAECMRS